jgi:hypothetical protein
MRVGSFVLALEGEHAAGVGERAGHVLQQQPLEDLAVVFVLRQRHLADLAAGERGVRERGADLLVANADHVLVAGVGLLHLRPHVEELLAAGFEVAVAVGG